MNHAVIHLAGETLMPQPSGALHWPSRDMLIVADLHLGKSARMARRGGSLLPPYETDETLSRLAAEIARLAPATVLCLGDSFDDLAAADGLAPEHRETLAGLQSGRRWLWVEGNHDPGAHDLGGEVVAAHREGALVFRHIAQRSAAAGEVSGHYHPKARIRGGSRPCFLADEIRLICPAFGCYTGGLDWTTPRLRGLFGDRGFAWLTGRRVVQVPLPRPAAAATRG